MAGHEWDWFQREELIGQISDLRVQNLQVEREIVQKRTFTRWINLHLEKCIPPLVVKDLFVDIQDGKILMALLEVLTGQSLLHEYKSSTHRIFRLNNIAKALKFLEDSNVKLVSIDAAEIADGNPSLVLGLIWNIILFLQIKELTGNLNRMSSSSSLSSLPSGSESDMSHPSTPSTEKSLSVSIKDQRKAIKALLSWVQQRTRKFGVAVQDFAGSWRSGLAFLAVIKSIDPSLVSIKKALERSPRENLENAFTIAERRLNIPRLLEPEDVMVDSPDEQSIMTYVAQFLEHFPEHDSDDLTGQSREGPIEMTYVRFRDGPREEEGQIINLPRNEDNDITVELQTRALTPPQTHVFTEIGVPQNSTPTSMGDVNHSDQRSSDSTPKRGKRFKLNPFLDPMEMCPFYSTSGFNKNFKTAGLGGQAQPILLPNGQGDLSRDLVEEHLLSASSGEPKDLEPKLLSNNYNQHCDSSSSFSSISDREPNDLFSQSDDCVTSSGSIKPSPLSEDSGLMTAHDTNDEDDSCKYLLHLPKDDSVSDDSKPRTVFQAYRSTGDTSRSRSPVDSAANHPEGEADSTDGRASTKVSIIPHDLFYYPHYSVPIADVLQAFSDRDSVVRTNSDASSDDRTDGSESFNGEEDIEAARMGDGVSVTESELGSEHNLDRVSSYADSYSLPPSMSSRSNGSSNQMADGVSVTESELGSEHNLQEVSSYADSYSSAPSMSSRSNGSSNQMADGVSVTESELGSEHNLHEVSSYADSYSSAPSMSYRSNGSSNPPTYDQQPSNLETFQVSGREYTEEDLDEDEDVSVRKVTRGESDMDVEDFQPVMTESDLEEELHGIEERAAKLAADMESSLMNSWFPRETPDDSHTEDRRVYLVSGGIDDSDEDLTRDIRIRKITGSESDFGEDLHRVGGGADLGEEDLHNVVGPSDSEEEDPCGIVGESELTEEEFHSIEERAARLAADMKASLRDLWFTGEDTEDMLDANKNGQWSMEPIREVSIEADEDQYFGLSKQASYDRESSGTSAAPAPLALDGELWNTCRIGLILWFILYCLMILPEFDSSKVSFFVEDN
ncbi:calmin isoform X2 [Hyperolius riggenbachi]|uniref:calmin isoform X2 n=1 Tax=Hyperolius riggenbachi TaxID=752182 RepID=UPI0035A2AC7B